MNWPVLAAFVPLAILCNTAVPIPFDPVLIAFASRLGRGAAVELALIGSLCAGVAAALDLTLFKNIRSRTSGRTSERWVRFLPLWSGRGAYALTFLFALLPLPFSIVRMAMLRNPPKMIPYLLSVALGRLPRYFVTIQLWRAIPWTTRGRLFFCVFGLLITAIHWSWSLKKSPGGQKPASTVPRSARTQKLF